MRSKFLQMVSVAVLFLLATTQAVAQVNIQVIPWANGCKGAVIYNNSSHLLEIKVGYIYEGRDGSHYSGETIPYSVGPRSNYTVSWLYNGPVDCDKPYSVRTNYTYVDKTVQAEQAQAAQKRQADAERQRQEQFSREQQRRQDEAKAQRERERSEMQRRRDAEHKRQYEEHLRRQEAARNKPWGQGCPKGLHC